MSFALWPFQESSDVKDWWARTPDVPENHPAIAVYTGDAVEAFREAFRATIRLEDRCHTTLLLSIALMSLGLANGEIKSIWHAAPLLPLSLAILVLLKTRVPFDRPVGVAWPEIAKALTTTNAAQDWRARIAYGTMLSHLKIQRALSIHIAVALTLITWAILWHAANLVFA